jgi:NADH-quinone oxidoreductase subunit E
MAGSRGILEELGRHLGIGLGETTAGGMFTLESTECLGQCDTAPGLAVDEVYFGNLTPKTIGAILHKFPV